jgi:hypothetical protein
VTADTTPQIVQAVSVGLDADWLDTHKPGDLSPERRLMLAVLEDAIQSATRPDDPACLECRRWIEDLSDYRVFSFVFICEEFGLDAGGARRIVMAREGYQAPARYPEARCGRRPGRVKKAA